MDRITVNELQAAEMLSISKRKLFDLSKKEGFPYIKVGRRKLYAVEDILLWVNSKKVVNNG